MSTTLTKLKINVEAFGDCLYLLDGRFTSLSTLLIHVQDITSAISIINNTVSIISIIVLCEKTLN
jgi:hypothetical protein